MQQAAAPVIRTMDDRRGLLLFHLHPVLHKYLRNGTFLHCRFFCATIYFRKKGVFIYGNTQKEFHPAGGPGEYTQKSEIRHSVISVYYRLRQRVPESVRSRKFHCRSYLYHYDVGLHGPRLNLHTI